MTEVTEVVIEEIVVTESSVVMMIGETDRIENHEDMTISNISQELKKVLVSRTIIDKSIVAWKTTGNEWHVHELMINIGAKIFRDKIKKSIVVVNRKILGSAWREWVAKKDAPW
jgi:hypothetical protein